jgi:quercetin dioxygenase-like cupin family protein
MSTRTGMLLAAAIAIVNLPAPAAEPGEPAATQAPPQIKRTVLRRTDVPDSNYEVVIVLVEAPAGASAGKHTHPGTVSGYVIEGNYTLLIEGRPPQALKAGESLEVPSGAVHDERAGTTDAKLLGVFTVEKGKPLTSPAP